MIFVIPFSFCSEQHANITRKYNKFEIVLSYQVIRKVQIYYQRNADNVMVYIPKGNYLNNLVHGEPKMH